MDIKKAASTPISVEQSSSVEKSSAPSSKPIQTGISSTKDSYEKFVSDAAAHGGAIDPNALVQHVLRESYLQTTEDLRSYAEKVKYFNETKKEVRDYLEKLRDADTKLKSEFNSLQPGQKSDVMDAASQAINESTQDSNENKQYYLNLLSGMSKTSDAVSEMTLRMTEASTALATKEKDDDD